MKPEEILDIRGANIEDELHVFLKLKRVHEICPFCNLTNVLVKEYKLRKINHAVLPDKKCVLHYYSRRYQCKDCKTTFFESNTFVGENSNLSHYTITRILNELKKPNYTFSDVARNCFVSTTQVINIFDHFVEFKRSKLPTYLCIDEVYFSRTSSQKYNCILYDFEAKQIVDIIASRQKHSLHSYFQLIPESERRMVKYVSIDMWTPYKDIAECYLKNAIIGVDPFHVSAKINTELQNVRKRIMSRYKIDSTEYYLLKNWNYLLSINESKISYNTPKWNRKLKRYINRNQLLELLLNIDQELKLAWQIKERYTHFNSLRSVDNYEERLNLIIDEFYFSEIKEYKSVSRMIKNWKVEIINSFTFIDNRRVTNGPLESINSRIKLIKRNGMGYQNFSRYRDRIIYCLNKNSVPNLIGKYKSK